MAIIAVTYTYAAEPERLDAVRPEHREFLGDLHATGVVVVSGPLPATAARSAGALLILEAPDAEVALHLLDADPFVRAGLVTERSAREWVPVIGSLGG
ncbi:YciI family protein [Isoptericola aurantiacus]|uniref:YciI family protein n=1 Tax=Isoptericola aurantiacus TaxID=3377839 RepID=UPI00383A3D9A